MDERACAAALTSVVLPVPGGPTRRTPRGQGSVEARGERARKERRDAVEGSEGGVEEVEVEEEEEEEDALGVTDEMEVD